MRVIYTFILFLLSANSAFARDDKVMLSFTELLASAEFKEKVGSEVRFYFGTQATPAVEKNLGDLVSNRKTNAFNKSDTNACKWIMLGIMMQFKQSAIERGGNAVIGMESYYKKRVYSSQTDYECHAGVFVAGIAMRGTVVKLRN